MKSFIKLLALVLTFTLLLSALAACDSGNEKHTEADSSETNATSVEQADTAESETEFSPDIDQKDYNTEFFLSIQPEHNTFHQHWVEESDNDVLSQAVFDRQQKIYSYLGVDIIGSATLTGRDYADPFKIAVKNKDGSVDTLLSHVYHGIDSFITGNFLADISSFSQINLSADYWDLDMMEDAAINGKYYLGKSDFNLLWTFVVAYNKDMMDKYADALDESVYEMVDNYHWTLDKMISLANMVYIDSTGDGQSVDDTFGIIGCQDIAFCGFLHSSNINIVEQNESGAYVLSAYNELNKAKTTEIIEKIHGLAKSDYAWFWKYNEGHISIGLQSGRALLSLSDTKGHLPSYPNYDVRFGVLPYPMFDEAQKDVGYRTLQWGGYICVPTYLTDRNMVGDTLEMLAFYSQDVHVAFYEKLLGKQASESPDDTRMLDIVWDNLCTDFAQTYYGTLLDTQILFIVPRLTYEDTTNNLASFVAGQEKTVNKKIEKFIALASKQK